MPRWTNTVNEAIARNIAPRLSASRLTRYLRVPGVGRVNIERNGTLTAAGRAWHQRTGTRFVAQTVPPIDYANAQEMYTRDLLRRFIRGRDGRNYLTQDWDPVSMTARLTKHWRRLAAQGTVHLSVEIPVTNIVRATGRTWTDYLLWSKLSDENEEVRVLRPVQDRQAHLRRVLTPPGTGFREEGTTFLNAARSSF